MQYEVSILTVEELNTLSGIWSDGDLRRLLDMADMDDIGTVEDSELLDITIMALQDLGNQKAGELVLEAVFGDSMRSGVRQNLVDDLQQDEPWEEYPNVSQQRGLFVAVVLLEKAFPNRYAAPEALRIRLNIRAMSDGGSTSLKEPDPAWLMRLLARGMSETDVLNRLYENEIASGPFHDAAGMIWHCEVVADPRATERSITLELTGPRMWFEPLSRGQIFRARA